MPVLVTLFLVLNFRILMVPTSIENQERAPQSEVLYFLLLTRWADTPPASCTGSQSWGWFGRQGCRL